MGGASNDGSGDFSRGIPDLPDETMAMAGEGELARRLRGYRMTTAEILYHLPDHPGLLQSFVWQQLDIAPRYPVLRRFLTFWESSIEGRLHSVRIAGASLLRPEEMRAVSEYRLH